MHFKNIYYQFIVLFLCFYGIHGDYSNRVRLCNIDCVVLVPGYILNKTCSIRALSRFRTVANADFYLAGTYDTVFVHAQLFKKNSMRYLPFMINYTVDLCSFLKGDFQSFYARYFTNWISKYGNLVHPCPYSGHIFVKDLEPFGEKIPVFAPLGDYRLDLNFYIKPLKKLIAYVRGYGTVSLKPFAKL